MNQGRPSGVGGATSPAGWKENVMRLKLYALIVLALVLSGDSLTRVRADESVDTSRIHVKRAIADRMTPAELQAYKERLARIFPAGRPARTSPPRRTPADTCPGATNEVGPLPYGPVADTTVGAADNYDLPPDVVDPTCAAPTTCTGKGPAGSLPEGPSIRAPASDQIAPSGSGPTPTATWRSTWTRRAPRTWRSFSTSRRAAAPWRTARAFPTQESGEQSRRSRSTLLRAPTTSLSSTATPRVAHRPGLRGHSR